MNVSAAREITVFLAPKTDRERDHHCGRLSFEPPDIIEARWVVCLPADARIVSDRTRGILVERPDEGYDLGPLDILSRAYADDYGFHVIDGYDPDHWLERIARAMKWSGDKEQP